MKHLSNFSLTHIFRKLHYINLSIKIENPKAFPRPKEHMLSWYEYKKRFVDISPQGYFSKSRLITSLIDFSFIRSLVAHTFSKEGTNPYDPCSLFLLELFSFIEGFRSFKEFLIRLHHPQNGHAYRVYAGIFHENAAFEKRLDKRIKDT